MTKTPSEPTSLEPASIVAEARERAGLEAFGDESFLEPFERTMHALATEGRLNEGGRLGQRERTIGLLVNRLRVEDWLSRHPEIHDEELRVPVVVCGLPRTGTTMLQRLLASDPDALSARWFETRYPAPFPEDDWTRRDARIAAGKEEIRLTLEAVPELATVHPWDAEAPDEEIMLLEHTFLSWMAEAQAHTPALGRWLRQQDMTPAYDYLKTLLRFLQWQKRKAGNAATSWVLKSPCHLLTVETLLEAFPDAKVVQTHRDPFQTIPSICSFQLFMWSLATDHVDPFEVGRVWGGNWREALEHALLMRESRYPERFIDVDYLDVARDPAAEVRRIYAATGRTLSPAAEEEMRKWAERNKRENRPPHEYTMQQFGFSEEQLATDFRAYRERFILDREA